ncbi:zinc-ribbon domain-containing protein [Streptomyces sp. NPDC002120]|uniref:NADase-type glycan-binding domain-containing protein n=1 Tax=Streptomyces sp. NPDC002120 TaxID=3364631 RepID=UPI00368D3A98
MPASSPPAGAEFGLPAPAGAQAAPPSATNADPQAPTGPHNGSARPAPTGTEPATPAGAEHGPSAPTRAESAPLAAADADRRAPAGPRNGSGAPAPAGAEAGPSGTTRSESAPPAPAGAQAVPPSAADADRQAPAGPRTGSAPTPSGAEPSAAVGTARRWPWLRGRSAQATPPEAAPTAPVGAARWLPWLRTRSNPGVPAASESRPAVPARTESGPAAAPPAPPARPDTPSPAPVAPRAPAPATPPAPAAASPQPVQPARAVAPRPVVRPAPVSDDVAGVPCPSCGTPNPPDRRFCRRCAAPLTPSTAPPPLPWWRTIWPLRRRTRAGSGRMVRFLVVLAVVLALCAGGFLLLPAGRNLIEDTRDKLGKAKAVTATRVEASAEVQGHPVGNSTDGLSNRYWGAPAPGASVTYTFAKPFRLVAVIVTNGASSSPEEYAKQARALQIDMEVTSKDGRKVHKRLALSDKPGPQTFPTGISDAATIRLTLDAPAGSAPDRHLALAEVEFFQRS